MKPFCVAVLAAVAAAATGGAGLRAQQPGPGAPPPACKVCVTEPKPRTRTVYSCKDEGYCLPKCSLLSLILGRCGCDGGPCGDLRVRRRLVVKKVPDGDTTQCVPREIPAADGTPPRP